MQVSKLWEVLHRRAYHGRGSSTVLLAWKAMNRPVPHALVFTRQHASLHPYSAHPSRLNNVSVVNFHHGRGGQLLIDDSMAVRRLCLLSACVPDR